MKRSRFIEQQIAFALQQAEQGTQVAEVTRKLGIREQTFYRFQKLRMGRKIKGRIETLPIRLLPHQALRLLASQALSSRRAGRIYHEPLNGKKSRIFSFKMVQIRGQLQGSFGLLASGHFCLGAEAGRVP